MSPSLPNTTFPTSLRCRCSCRWILGLVRNADGALEPKLVELQAFPSLYGYQAAAAHQYVESYGLSPELGIYLSGHDDDSYWRLLRQTHRRRSRSRKRDPDGDRSRASEDAAGFPYHATQAGHRHRRHSLAGEARPTALLSQERRRSRDRSAPHLQPLHRRRAGAQRNHVALRSARGARCRVGRPSQLVLPHQQVLHSVSQAPERSEDLVPRPASRDSSRPRELSAQAAVFLCRSRNQIRSHASRTSTRFRPINATTTFFRSACSSSR